MLGWLYLHSFSSNWENEIGLRGWGDPACVGFLAWFFWFFPRSFKSIFWEFTTIPRNSISWVWVRSDFLLLIMNPKFSKRNRIMWICSLSISTTVATMSVLFMYTTNKYPLISASLLRILVKTLGAAQMGDNWIGMSSFLGWREKVAMLGWNWNYKEGILDLLWPFNCFSVGDPWLCVGLPSWNALISCIC